MLSETTVTPSNNDRKNLLAINLGLAANVLLAALKTSVGIVGGSPALLADGINSTSDVVYLVIVRIFMGLAGKPPDREHPFGHRQLEGIAAVVVGAFVVTTGVTVFWKVIYDVCIGAGDLGRPGAMTLWVALLTVVLKVALTALTYRTARQTQSIAVLALARDHRNDIFTIVTATVGIVLGMAGHLWVDPAAAALVALVILYTGVTIIRESSANLMEILPDKKVARRIRELVAAVDGVDQAEEIDVHRIGHYMLVSVTIGINGNLTVAAGDEIASRVEQVLHGNVEYLRHVSVHYHPTRPRKDPPPV